MKKNISLSVLLLVISTLANAQIFVGIKGGYNRFFEPGMNGGNIGLFTELPFGDYLNSSLRVNLYYNAPMKYEDLGTLYPYPGTYESNEHIPVYSKYKNAGISFEYMYYFGDDAFTTGLYSSIKGGVSYSTITRTVEEFNTSVYYLNDNVQNNTQFSVCFEFSLGFQFSLGPNDLFFTEIQMGFPFLQLSGSSAESSTISGYPVIGIAGNIGFKHSLFN